MATRDVDIATGLLRQEALVRARKLRQLIREGTVSPSDVELDEDGKDVLYALVKLVEEAATGSDGATAAEIDAVYKFLRGIQWPLDELNEKVDLLRQCATVGWRCFEVKLLDTGRRCRSLNEGRGLAGLTSAQVDTSFSLEPTFEKCRALYEKLNFCPRAVLEETTQLYFSLKASDQQGLLDERDQALGETAAIAGSAARVVGMRSRALDWLNRAERSFRNSACGAPGIAYVNFSRTAILVEEGHGREAFTAAAFLRKEFESYGAGREAAKCCLIQAMVLKVRDGLQEAFDLLARVARSSAVSSDPYLCARLLCELADIAQLQNELALSTALFSEAEQLLQGRGTSGARADLATFIGGAFARVGNLEAAAASLRQAIADSLQLGLRTRVAYLRVVLADILLSDGRGREAKAEILAAMPTIEEEAMMKEGIAALTLLKESIQRRSMDPNALRDLRDCLQSKRWE